MYLRHAWEGEVRIQVRDRGLSISDRCGLVCPLGCLLLTCPGVGGRTGCDEIVAPWARAWPPAGAAPPAEYPCCAPQTAGSEKVQSEQARSVKGRQGEPELRR